MTSLWRTWKKTIPKSTSYLKLLLFPLLIKQIFKLFNAAYGITTSTLTFFCGGMIRFRIIWTSFLRIFCIFLSLSVFICAVIFFWSIVFACRVRPTYKLRFCRWFSAFRWWRWLLSMWWCFFLCVFLWRTNRCWWRFCRWLCTFMFTFSCFSTWRIGRCGSIFTLIVFLLNREIGKKNEKLVKNIETHN